MTNQAAVQPGHGLHGVAVHDRPVQEYASLQRLIEAGLEFVRNHHDPIVIALEAVFDQFAGLQLVDRMFSDGLVGLRVDEIREVERYFVISIESRRSSLVPKKRLLEFPPTLRQIMSNQDIHESRCL